LLEHRDEHAQQSIGDAAQCHLRLALVTATILGA